MDRRNVFKGALAGALAFVGSRRLAAAEAIPGETLELNASDWVQVLPDVPEIDGVSAFGYHDDVHGWHYPNFAAVPGYGWKETTGSGVLLPENLEGLTGTRIVQRTVLARSFRKNYVELGIVAGPDEFGNWFVPDWPDAIPEQGYERRLPAGSRTKVMVRDHGVLAGSPEPFLFRWDWAIGGWVLNRESWTEDQV